MAKLFIAILTMLTLVGCQSTRTDIQQHSYRAILIDGNIYLKPLFNDAKPFGPFVLNEGKTSCVHIPEDRPQEFGSAEQIFGDDSTGTWLFSDNYVQMRAQLVDPSNVLKK